MTALLIAVGVLCAINTGLALLLMIAAATLGRVGPCRITINGEKALTVAGGRSLLATLKAGDHLLMTDSCYGPTRHLTKSILPALGVETSFYDPRAGAGISSTRPPFPRWACARPARRPMQPASTP